MAFNQRDKEMLGGGAAVRFFAYKTKEPTVEVLKPDYFRYWSELELNDLVYVVTGDGAFFGVVAGKNPTILRELDLPMSKDVEPGMELSRLRRTAKELGINSYGKGIAQLTEEIKNKTDTVKL